MVALKNLNLGAPAPRPDEYGNGAAGGWPPAPGMHGFAAHHAPAPAPLPHPAHFPAPAPSYAPAPAPSYAPAPAPSYAPAPAPSYAPAPAPSYAPAPPYARAAPVAVPPFNAPAPAAPAKEKFKLKNLFKKKGSKAGPGYEKEGTADGYGWQGQGEGQAQAPGGYRGPGDAIAPGGFDSGLEDAVPPQELMCPISKLLMAEPVTVSSGVTYEKRCFEAWFQSGQRYCLRTNIPMETSVNILNIGVAQQTARWCQEHQRGFPLPPTPEVAALYVNRILREQGAHVPNSGHGFGGVPLHEGHGGNGSGGNGYGNGGNGFGSGGNGFGDGGNGGNGFGSGGNGFGNGGNGFGNGGNGFGNGGNGYERGDGDGDGDGNGNGNGDGNGYGYRAQYAGAGNGAGEAVGSGYEEQNGDFEAVADAYPVVGEDAYPVGEDEARGVYMPSAGVGVSDGHQYQHSRKGSSSSDHASSSRAGRGYWGSDSSGEVHRPWAPSSRPGSSGGARPGSSGGARPGSSGGARPGSSSGARTWSAAAAVPADGFRVAVPPSIGEGVPPVAFRSRPGSGLPSGSFPDTGGNQYVERHGVASEGPYWGPSPPAGPAPASFQDVSSRQHGEGFSGGLYSGAPSLADSGREEALPAYEEALPAYEEAPAVAPSLRLGSGPPSGSFPDKGVFETYGAAPGGYHAGPPPLPAANAVDVSKLAVDDDGGAGSGPHDVPVSEPYLPSGPHSASSSGPHSPSSFGPHSASSSGPHSASSSGPHSASSSGPQSGPPSGSFPAVIPEVQAVEQISSDEARMTTQVASRAPRSNLLVHSTSWTPGGSSQEAVAAVAAAGFPLSLKTVPSSYSGERRPPQGIPEETSLTSEVALQFEPSVRSGAGTNLEYLAEKLYSKYPKEQEEAAAEIRKLTRDSTENRLALCCGDLGEKVLGGLMELLQARSQAVRVNAVAALMNLSLERENKLKIARAGVIPHLIEVLRGSGEAQEIAAGAIFSLALNEENRMPIGVLGAIPHLMHILREGQGGARRDAAMALYHLSFVQMNRSKLVRAGGVNSLMGLAQEHQSDLVSRALLILSHLALIPEGRAALSEMSNVSILVELLKGPINAEAGEDVRPQNWAEVREHAAAALFQLSNNNLRFRSQVAQTDAEEHLMVLASTGTPRARAKASALLKILRETTTNEGRESAYPRGRQSRPDRDTDQAPSSALF